MGCTPSAPGALERVDLPHPVIAGGPSESKTADSPEREDQAEPHTAVYKLPSAFCLFIFHNSLFSGVALTGNGCSCILCTYQVAVR